MYTLYQVQLERNTNKEEESVIYSLEVPTNDFDAIELAKIFIADKYNDYDEFLSLGGFCEIGYSKTDEIKDNTKSRKK